MKHQQLMRFGLELEAAQMNPLSYGGNNTVFYYFHLFNTVDSFCR